MLFNLVARPCSGAWVLGVAPLGHLATLEHWDVVRYRFALRHVLCGLDVADCILMALNKSGADALAPASGFCALS
jgi:hypothetical protein